MMIAQPAARSAATDTPGRRRKGRGARWAGLVAAATAAVIGGTLLAAPAANAATLSATVSATVGKSGAVTATAKISASPTASATLAGICARNAAGHHYDFPLKAAGLKSSGTTLTASRTLPAGSYSYWACAKIGGKWNDIGTKRTLTVPKTASAAAPGTSTAAPAPSTNPKPNTSAGAAPMPVGDLPGWKQVFTDDFTADAAQGSFQRVYGTKWSTYHNFADTWGNGWYDRNYISAQNGVLDFDLKTVNGKPVSFAPAPIVTKAWQGQTYGRFTARFRADALPGYKTAWLLWPDSNNWNEGEVDFPEGGLDEEIFGFNHCVGTPSKNCFWVNSKQRYTDWHTVTIEWAPNRLTYIMDGKVLGTTTTSVPTTPMHWILQTETEDKKPAADVAGHLQVDWVAVYTYQP